MRRPVTLTFIIIAVVIGLWTAGSLYVMRGIEFPAHETLVATDDYEIRRYPAMLVAETRTARAGDDDSRFQVLAGFIFGGNDRNESIAMTAPVLMSGGGTVAEPGVVAPPSMRFIMPAERSRDSLPAPDDARVDIVELPERIVAVRRFGWFATASARRWNLDRLVTALRRDGIEIRGEPVYAAYQPPFSVPFLKRHEMQLDVAAPRRSS